MHDKSFAVSPPKKPIRLKVYELVHAIKSVLLNYCGIKVDQYSVDFDYFDGTRVEFHGLLYLEDSKFKEIESVYFGIDTVRTRSETKILPEGPYPVEVMGFGKGEIKTIADVVIIVQEDKTMLVKPVSRRDGDRVYF